MLNVCFTADHELFSGENYMSEEDVVINPTYRLMEVLSENEASLVLMTDVCSILRYRELGMHEFPERMEKQLKYAIENGHDVQLHIHPHWIYSTYENGKWEFDYNRFRIHDFGFDEDGDSELSASCIIKMGKAYLEELLKPVDSSYKCRVYRAGGWNIQPEKELFKSLRKEGISIDTSIFRSGYSKSDTHYFDYRNVPDEINWWIHPELGIDYKAQKSSEAIFEMVIGSCSKKPYIWGEKLKNKLINKIRTKEHVQKGVTLEHDDGTFIRILANRIRNFISQPIMLTYDNLCSEVMVDIVKHYLESYDCENNEYYLAIIGHPKSISERHILEVESFCKHIRTNYSNVVKFISTRDINI